MKVNGSLNEDIAIQIENLTVRYRVPGEKISTLKEYLDRFFNRKLRYKEFVALKNLNLTIKKGERIGIIGHNGAGKSTLLKAIANVIKPTEGTVEVYGTIAPLLELGAGFDLELTGIRNIYLNGSFLGKSKQYLDSVREDIIDFAELGEFINYPVKNYSSGMRAKLGFAIATQVDSEILLVDEVFGVGDENFKRKSKEKMLSMINSGKTVVIVSHDMTQMVDLTDRVIWMDNGEIIEDGPPQEICDKYCEFMLEHQNIVIEHREARAIRKKERKERQKRESDQAAGNRKNSFLRKTGLFDRILNDPETMHDILSDRRIRREIYKNDEILDGIFESENALDLIVENDDLLYKIFTDETVKSKAAENPFLFADLERKATRIIGNVDDCVYYGESALLYVKGWYLPAGAYNGVRIYLDDELLGEANLHLRRTGAGKDSDSWEDRFPGWEFFGELSLSDEARRITVVILHHEEILEQYTVSVEMQTGRIPAELERKYGRSISEKSCWDIYQKYVLGGFSLLSFQRQNVYRRLLEEQVGIGAFFKKNYCSEGGEFCSRTLTNSLGLRGPADTEAQYAVFGGGYGLALGVDEADTWYSREEFSDNWINLCYVCRPNQIIRLMNKYLARGHRFKHVILLYEASFWSVATAKNQAVTGPMESDAEEILSKEREGFLDFYNKLWEGVFRIVKEKEELKLLNCRYGQFDFAKNRGKCEDALQSWWDVLERAERVTVLRVPNTAYVYAVDAQDDTLKALRENQDEGWNLFVKEFKKHDNVRFVETESFDLQDFLFSPGLLSKAGNEKLAEQILENI